MILIFEQKVKRSAHCVQIIHSSGRSRFDEPNFDDSSDDADEFSSDDEEVFGPPLRPRPPKDKATKIREQDQKVLSLKAANDARVKRVRDLKRATRRGNPIPPEDPAHPDASLELDRHDFIFMEYMEMGSLLDTLHRVAEEAPPRLIPNKVLWSFWLCMFLGPAMHDYDRGDIDVYNPPQVANPLPVPAPIDIEMENSFPIPNETPEHDEMPIVKESFSPDWDYMPLTRDGREISQEPVAGNYDVHTNVWHIGLTMWQLITRLEVPEPSRLTDAFYPVTIGNTYGITLDMPVYNDVDLELRRTVARCLTQDPRAAALAGDPPGPGEKRGGQTVAWRHGWGGSWLGAEVCL
ncbi:kinase-like domain-containing protein [Apiospora phragmitis]|uniref:Kinase-like domain-containing protein n=1 Tax=Apiospora phragmitis TaxID=2905665 RepID=A0ABR1VCC7_9PEZI